MDDIIYYSKNHSYRFRKFVPNDIPSLSKIIENVFIEYSWVYIEKDEVPDFVNFAEYYANGKKARLYTVELEGTSNPVIVGCIALKFNNEGPYLSRVYLTKAYRGLGLGKWMTNMVIDIARKEGHQTVHLWTDTRFLDAHAMYRRIGFERTTDLRSLHDVNTSFEFKMVLNLNPKDYDLR
jgi:RimJ/RimL family protein N-acetyltransferase